MYSSLIKLGMVSIMWNLGAPPSAETFTAYDCTNQSNLVEYVLLLKPDACSASEGNGEMETTM
jgi:hypothetical protein